jgi:DNA-binding MarR family transcriptional regulator
MQEAAERVRNDRGLTSTSAMILILLENSGPQTTRQISEAMRMDYKYMGRLMRQLWDKKRVTQSFAGTTSYWRVRR